MGLIACAYGSVLSELGAVVPHCQVGGSPMDAAGGFSPRGTECVHGSFAHLSQDRSQDSALPLNGGHVPSGEESPSCSRSAPTAALNRGGKQRVCVYTNTHAGAYKQGPPCSTGLHCSARPRFTG